VLKDKKYAAGLSKKCFEQSKKFSWEKSRKIVKDLYIKLNN
jgi:hypothetical protein